MPRGGRGRPCVFLKAGNQIVSLDFGEGCQEAYFGFGLGVNVPLVVLVSHLHGDHILGIRPFLETLTMLSRRRRVTIVGPRLTEWAVFGGQTVNTTFPVEIVEVYGREGRLSLGEMIVDYVVAPHALLSYSYIIRLRDKINLDPTMLEADGIPPPLRRRLLEEGYVAYNGRTVFLEKYVRARARGVKIAYSGDTMPNYRLASKSLHADLLIHEATLTHADLLESGKTHSSALQAAQIARYAKAKLLALVHRSSRYDDDTPLLREAQKVFPRTILPRRGDIIEISASSPRIFYFHSFTKAK